MHLEDQDTSGAYSCKGQLRSTQTDIGTLFVVLSTASSRARITRTKPPSCSTERSSRQQERRCRDRRESQCGWVYIVPVNSGNDTLSRLASEINRVAHCQAATLSLPLSPHPCVSHGSLSLSPTYYLTTISSESLVPSYLLSSSVLHTLLFICIL